jgi:hypothetical protein
MTFQIVRKPGRSAMSARGKRCAALIIVLSLTASVSPCYAAAPQPAAPDAETTTPEGVGLQAASVLASVVYLPVKGAVALAGGLVGGLAYAVTMGDLETAEAIWEPSFYGTYLITPEHLTGDRPVELIGARSPTP